MTSPHKPMTASGDLDLGIQMRRLIAEVRRDPSILPLLRKELKILGKEYLIETLDLDPKADVN